MSVRYARYIPALFFAMAVTNLGMGLTLVSQTGEFQFPVVIGAVLLVAALSMWRARMMVLHDDRLGLQNPMGMELRRYRFDQLRIETTGKGRVLYGTAPGKAPKRLLAETGLTYDRADARALLDALTRRLQAPGRA
ncbi:MAG: hypothetical protein HLUCCA08_06860 [Rhodobacteraceae bacterium HLUCCA08]|nr:MAG: hypothetical protein HLUCCA08_06860 [Rhodobacteraceae bacterium HLUCCA08]